MYKQVVTDFSDAFGTNILDLRKLERSEEILNAAGTNKDKLPYLLGERSPRWNPDTSGAFLGVKPKHDEKDYVRAVIEGIAMNMELILKAYRKQEKIENMCLTGGGASGSL